MVPFRAWRYSPKAGELDRLVAPPYDVIEPGLQSALYARSPYNVVRIDLGMTVPEDDDRDNPYTRAAALIAGWKESGVLERDPLPTMTFVEESFTGPDGRAGHRHGVLAALRLSEFGEGLGFPHEHTLTGPKEDRFRLMTTTGMSLSPVFLLYELPGDEITTAWKQNLSALPPSSSTADDSGNVTNLWVTAGPGLLDVVTAALAGRRFLVADGHHRYETALRYQEARRTERAVGGDGQQASDYCLVYLANLSDPALTIYPTHRLVRGLPDALVGGLPGSLRRRFDVERLSSPPVRAAHAGDEPAAAAQSGIARYLQHHPRGAFGLWGRVLDAPYGFRLADPAAAHISQEHSTAYQELDVTILQTLVLEQTLGVSAEEMAEERHVSFFKDAKDAFSRLGTGEFQAGFFMNPTGLEQVCKVAFGGERMPQKTTFFYPKLPTGLVFHDLTGRL